MGVRVAISRRKICGFASSEWTFIGLLIGAMVLVVYVGRFSLVEARRTEEVKQNAVVLLKWFDDLNTDSSAVSAELVSRCKPASVMAGNTEKNTEKTWQGCRDALSAEGGPLHGVLNPFDAQAPVFNEKCDRSQLVTRGAIVVDEALKMPPGQSAVFVPMALNRTLEKDLSFRVVVCDKGSFAIKIGESKL